MSEPFFPEPPDDVDDAPEYHGPPRNPRHEPPRDEVGTLVHIGEVIASTDRVALVLTSVKVYRDGVMLYLERHLRRNGLGVLDWQRLQNDFAGYWNVSPPGERLRRGLAFGDGRRVVVDVPFPTGDESDRDHSLVQRGGGGGGSMDRQTCTDELWLHPLPPEGPLEVVVQWPAMGIPESRVILDGTAIVERAAPARPIWPDETARSGGTD